MSLTIRSVTRQDYDQWLPLWDGYNAFYGRSGPTALAPEITRDDVAALLRRLLSRCMGWSPRATAACSA